MGLHGYCVVPPGRRPRIAGLAGAEVRVVPVLPVALWTSEHPHRPVATVEAARVHDAVIRDAFDEQLTPVPLRFGQWFEDADDLASCVAEHVPRWASQLAELAGTVELSIRLIGGAPAAAPPPAANRNGTAYMQALLERHQATAALRARREEVLATLRTALSGLVERELVAAEPDGDTFLSVAYLVRRARLEACRAALAPLSERFAELRLHTTGPWPPYSFVA